MAIVRSQAFQNARKSVGQNNYYRRAGVQISRSKPTFAPGRVFTPSQLNQQSRMSAIYNLNTVFGLFGCSDYCNTQNNKRYNASSRINRLIGNMLKNAKRWNPSIYEDPNEYFVFNLLNITHNFSIGNVVNPVVEVYVDDTGGLEKTVYELLVIVNKKEMESMLASANKKRAASSQFTWQNIGVCGFIGAQDWNEEQYNYIPPTMFEDLYGDMDNKDNAQLSAMVTPVDQPFVNDNTQMNICFFLVDYWDPTNHVPLTKAIYSTSSKRVKVWRL